MGTFGGPKPIVTEGLVFAVDAGNNESFYGDNSKWVDMINSTNGTLSNGPTYVSEYGGGLIFDGADETYEFPYNYNLTTQPFAVDIWFKPSQNTGYLQGILSCSDIISTVMSPGWGIGFDARSMRIQYGLYDEVNNVRYLMYRSATLVPGTVYNMFFYRNLETQRFEFYLNGELYNYISVPNTATLQGHRNTLNYKRWAYDAKPNATYYTMKVYHDTVFDSDKITKNFNSLRGRFGL